MAGEWIAVDLALDSKPEVQELIDTTGKPVEEVCFLLWKLWGWASMHCADGKARMTLPRLVRTCGGDEAFWQAVSAVGWLEIDQTAATVAVPGWDRRFSQAAKSRAQHADRSRAFEDRNPGRKKPPPGSSGADAPDVPAPERRRGEERRSSSSSPPDGCAWAEFREAWNKSGGKPWTPAGPPADWHQRALEDGWLELAWQAVKRVPKLRYFTTPITLVQLLQPGWAEKIVGGSFDEPKPEKRQRTPSGDEKAPPRVWSGPEEVARRKMLADLAAKKQEATA